MENTPLTPLANSEYHYVPSNQISPQKENTLTDQSEPETSFKGYAKIILDFIIQDIKKRPRSFKIGLFTVFLVITFIALLVNCLSIASVIFVKLSEDSVGDADIILTISSAVNDTRVTDEDNSNQALMRLLNHSSIQEATKDIQSVVGCSPRWLLFANAINTQNTQRNIRSYLLIYNASQERSIGLGRNLDTPMLNKGEIIITQSVLDTIGIDTVIPNKTTIYLNLDIITELLDSDMLDLTNLFNGSTSNATDSRSILSDQLRNQFITIFEQNSGQTIEDLESVTVNTEALKDAMEQIDPILDNPLLSPTLANTAIAGILNQAGLPSDSPLYEQLTNQENSVESLRNFSDYVQTLDNEVTINVSEIIEFMIEATLNASNMTFELTIMKVVDSPGGKWPSLLGNLVGLEQEFFLEMITETFFENYQKLLTERATADSQFALFTNLFDIITLQQMLEDQLNSVNLNEMVMLE